MKMMTTLGPTRVHAGINPFQSAGTPSFRIVCEKQSAIPEYWELRMIRLLTTSNGLQANAAMKPAHIAVTACRGSPSSKICRAKILCFISSYDASSAAARTVARPTVGPTPTYSPRTPSVLTISKNAPQNHLYAGPDDDSIPEAIIRTLMRSQGFASA